MLGVSNITIDLNLEPETEEENKYENLVEEIIDENDRNNEDPEGDTGSVNGFWSQPLRTLSDGEDSHDGGISSDGDNDDRLADFDERDRLEEEVEEMEGKSGV